MLPLNHVRQNRYRILSLRGRNGIYMSTSYFRLFLLAATLTLCGSANLVRAQKDFKGERPSNPPIRQRPSPSNSRSQSRTKTSGADENARLRSDTLPFNQQVEDALSQANAAMDRKEYAQAEAQYRRALTLDSREARAYFGLGNVYFAQANGDHPREKYQEAAKAYEQGLSLDPGYAETYGWLGDCYFLLERYDEAINAYRDGLKLKPRSAVLYDGLGSIYLFGIGNYTEAIKAYNEAIRLEPNYDDAHYGLGEAYLQINDKQAAMAQYRILKNLKSPLAEDLLKSIESK
jgi:tetratricopeptide (TPR) repeat protein